MGRITFINPFQKSLITGGIKATYSHAELLTELGYNVSILQPDGPPDWLPARLHTLVSNRLAPTADDILVFPEAFNGVIDEISRMPLPSQKVVFCQNQYYMVTYAISAEEYARRGFTKFIAPGEVSKQIIERVLKLPEVDIVPYFIDRDLFFPREKIMQIATVPRKFPYQDGIPAQADLLRTMLAMKYPQFSSVPWQLIKGRPEHDVAEIFGQSTIFLSLSRLEACPLTPLEAMASGCIVVGYTGYGGREYATSENGFWFSPEQLEEVTDALAYVIDGLARGDQKLLNMKKAAMETAARFNRQATKTALHNVYAKFSQSARSNSG